MSNFLHQIQGESMTIFSQSDKNISIFAMIASLVTQNVRLFSNYKNIPSWGSDESWKRYKSIFGHMEPKTVEVSQRKKNCKITVYKLFPP